MSTLAYYMYSILYCGDVSHLLQQLCYMLIVSFLTKHGCQNNRVRCDYEIHFIAVSTCTVCM